MVCNSQAEVPHTGWGNEGTLRGRWPPAAKYSPREASAAGTGSLTDFGQKREHRWQVMYSLPVIFWLHSEALKGLTYLFRALHISMVTSTDRAMVMGYGDSNTWQSRPSKSGLSGAHWRKWLYRGREAVGWGWRGESWRMVSQATFSLDLLDIILLTMSKIPVSLWQEVPNLPSGIL